MVKRLQPGLISGVREPLCCCEYINMHGEKTHILGICCDCEALDDTFDKIFKCEPVPDSTVDKLLSVLGDRLRVPTFFGAGAVKVRPDILTPILVVPSCLYLATLHPVMTIAVFAFMPCFIVFFHALWRRAQQDAPTFFFYSWGLTSVISAYVVFQCFVVAFREVLLWEILMVFTMMLVMFYFLYLTRRNPDLQRIVLKPRQGHKRTQSNMPHIKTMKPSSSSTSITIAETSNMDSNVKWMDSRTGAGKAEGPPRSGFCKICDAYITVRDHHCVWINACIGASNHRYFLLAMLMFIITGSYACHLTFTTICTPTMYFDWFLLPNDCRWLYADFLTSICFVTALYAAIGVSCMCVAFIYQFALISQNVTAHELARARGLGLVSFGGLFAQDNPNNHGLIRNWVDFWLSTSGRSGLDAYKEAL
ncbi:hypothetical protein EGW08_012073 [Elysia chlorotica]|uniref:Palmitoyltransferase n=1 Tax=Elysia chlorotica TaxID=188477 RepID=A0A433TF17_ELYCH|nr:hypothetical protein EGW08_012073 [Elysia chlorotica]